MMLFSCAIFVLFLSIPSVLGDQQGYRFIHEYATLKEINRKLITGSNFTFGKLNRTVAGLKEVTFVVNADLKTDEDCQIYITGYQFRSNEYRVGPIQFNMGCCTALKSKTFDIPKYVAGSNLKRCPMLKNVPYRFTNVVPDAKKFPPFIPEGKWMIELNFTLLRTTFAATLQWYTKVEKRDHLFS